MNQSKLIKTNHRVISAFPLNSAMTDLPLIWTTLKRTPGISPTACPFLPNPATVTSSFSFKKFKQPSFGTKAEIFFPFFLSNTLQHFLTAEFGYLDSLHNMYCLHSNFFNNQTFSMWCSHKWILVSWTNHSFIVFLISPSIDSSVIFELSSSSHTSGFSYSHD